MHGETSGTVYENVDKSGSGKMQAAPIGRMSEFALSSSVSQMTEAQLQKLEALGEKGMSNVAAFEGYGGQPGNIHHEYEYEYAPLSVSKQSQPFLLKQH